MLSKEKNVWTVSVALLLLLGGAGFFILAESDFHYAGKVMFQLSWTALMALVPLVGLLILAIRIGMFRSKNLLYVALMAALIFLNYGGLSWAAGFRKPSVLAKGLVEDGWKSMHDKDYDGAIKHFDEAIKANPKFAPAYYAKGYVYSIQSQFDLAIENYKTSIQLEPMHADSFTNLGLSYLYEKRLQEALDALQHAESMDPANGDIQVNLALYYFMKDNYKEAWHRLHRAQKAKAYVNPQFVHDLGAKMAEPKD